MLVLVLVVVVAAAAVDAEAAAIDDRRNRVRRHECLGRGGGCIIGLSD